MYRMFIINQQAVVARVLCPMIILHTWMILVGYLTKVKLWLISLKKPSQKVEPIIHCNAIQPQSNFIYPHQKTYMHDKYASRTTLISFIGEP